MFNTVCIHSLYLHVLTLVNTYQYHNAFDSIIIIHYRSFAHIFKVFMMVLIHATRKKSK